MNMIGILNIPVVSGLRLDWLLIITNIVNKDDFDKYIIIFQALIYFFRMM